MNTDPFNTGTPKYSTAQSIYEGLCALVEAEEITILSEMFADVSYEGQDYYYTDNGLRLKEKFEVISGYGNKMWLLDLAVFQLDEHEIHSIVFEAACNPDMAKRLGFKKLFVDIMLSGDGTLYDGTIGAFCEALRELDVFNYHLVQLVFRQVMQQFGREVSLVPYSRLCSVLYSKAKNLHLIQETQLIIECRALLNSYDDFMFNLRANQALYDYQERVHNEKLTRLQAAYDAKVKQLHGFAAQHGIYFDHPEGPPLLESASVMGENERKE